MSEEQPPGARPAEPADVLAGKGQPSEDAKRATRVDHEQALVRLRGLGHERDPVAVGRACPLPAEGPVRQGETLAATWLERAGLERDEAAGGPGRSYGQCKQRRRRRRTRANAARNTDQDQENEQRALHV